MIATLTANPCIDKTVSVQHFDVNEINRARVVRLDAAGKGINVASALRGLGFDAIALGFDFVGENGVSPLKAAMQERGMQYSFIDVPGHLRTCTKIVDESVKSTIEVNEYGHPVSAEDGERLIESVARTAADCDLIALSGSIPEGLGSDFYFRCAEAIKDEAPSCRIAIDAEKELLLEALEAGPFLIKPNIHEFQASFGISVSSINELDTAVHKLIRRYALGIVCVSLGGEGAFIADAEHSFSCQAVKVPVRSLHGAGDSMLAGICAALQLGLPLQEILHYGVAAAAASISREGTLLCTEELFRPLLAQDVNIRRIR